MMITMKGWTMTMKIDGARYKKIVNTGGRVMYVQMTDDEIKKERNGLLGLIPIMTVAMVLCFFCWWVTV